MSVNGDCIRCRRHSSTRFTKQTKGIIANRQGSSIAPGGTGWQSDTCRCVIHEDLGQCCNSSSG